MGKGLHHVVIIGGGFGGLSAALRLKDFPGEVTLIDKHNFHLFQPLLYQVATGLLCPSEITAPLRHILRKQKNTRVILGEAVDIDPAARKVILTDGTVGYDTLIVAAGMTNNYFGHDEWEKYAPGLKTIEDTSEIRNRIFYAFEVAERETDPELRREWLNFVVIGGGATGIELSGMIAEIAKNTLRDEFRSIHPEDAQVMILDAAQRLLPIYPSDLSKKTEESLTRIGVRPLTGAKVVDMDERGLTIERGGRTEHLGARTILWATGVRASPLGKKISKKTGADTDAQGRLKVNADLSVPGHPEIFIIGDLAHCPGKKGAPLPGLAPVATQQGRYVARLVMDRLAHNTSSRPFCYFDKGTMAVIGRNEAVAAIGRWHFAGYFAWMLWLFIHLLLLINFENRVIILIRWAVQYISYRHGARQLSLRGRLKLPLSRTD